MLIALVALVVWLGIALPLFVAMMSWNQSFGWSMLKASFWPLLFFAWFRDADLERR